MGALFALQITLSLQLQTITMGTWAQLPLVVIT